MRLRLRLPSPYSNTRIIILENSSLTVNHLKEKVAEELSAVNEQLSLSQFTLSLNGKEPLQIQDATCSLSSIGIVAGDLIRLIASSSPGQEPVNQRRACMRGNVSGTGAAVARGDTQKDDAKRSPVPDSDSTVLLRQLVEMGFEEHRSAVALASNGNDLQLALAGLTADQIQAAEQPSASSATARASASSAMEIGAPAIDPSQTTELERLTSLYDSAGVKTCRHAIVVLLHWILLEATSERGCTYELQEAENGAGWRQCGSVANTEFRLNKVEHQGRVTHRVRYIGMPRTPRGLMIFSNGVRSWYTQLFEFNFVDYAVPLSAGANAVYKNLTDAKQLVGNLLHTCLGGRTLSSATNLPSYTDMGVPRPSRRHRLGLPDSACSSHVTPEQNAASIAALSSLHDRACVETRQEAMVVLVQWILKELGTCLGLHLDNERLEEEDMPRLKACVDRELQYGRGASETGYFRIIYTRMPRSSSGVLRVSVRYDAEERSYSAALDETKYINIDCAFPSGVSETYLRPLCARNHIGRSFIGRGCHFIENAKSQHNRHHLLFLPQLVIEIILSKLDPRSLWRLCASCSHLQRLVLASEYVQCRSTRTG